MTRAAGGAIQSVVPDSSQAAGQDVLQEAFDKLRHWNADPLDLLGSVVAITKGELALLQTLWKRQTRPRLEVHSEIHNSRNAHRTTFLTPVRFVRNVRPVRGFGNISRASHASFFQRRWASSRPRPAPKDLSSGHLFAFPDGAPPSTRQDFAALDPPPPRKLTPVSLHQS